MFYPLDLTLLCEGMPKRDREWPAYQIKSFLSNWSQMLEYNGELIRFPMSPGAGLKCVASHQVPLSSLVCQLAVVASHSSASRGSSPSRTVTTCGQYLCVWVFSAANAYACM